MDRNDFIRLIGGGASFLLSGFGTKDLLYDLQEITIYDNYVRGVNFHREAYFKVKLAVGHAVALEREVDNPYDRFAIKILVNGLHIGYIAAYENVVMANLLDKGVRLRAVVSQINVVKEGDYLDQVVAVKVLAQLMVPINDLRLTDLGNDRADHAEDLYRNGLL